MSVSRTCQCWKQACAHLVQQWITVSSQCQQSDLTFRLWCSTCATLMTALPAPTPLTLVLGLFWLGFVFFSFSLLSLKSAAMSCVVRRFIYFFNPVQDVHIPSALCMNFLKNVDTPFGQSIFVDILFLVYHMNISSFLLLIQLLDVLNYNFFIWA